MNTLFATFVPVLTDFNGIERAETVRTTVGANGSKQGLVRMPDFLRNLCPYVTQTRTQTNTLSNLALSI